MQNNSFNSPTTLPPGLKRRKDELSSLFDSLKNAGTMPRPQYTKALIAINSAGSLEELDQISEWYNPKPKAA